MNGWDSAWPNHSRVSHMDLPSNLAIYTYPPTMQYAVFVLCCLCSTLWWCCCLPICVSC